MSELLDVVVVDEKEKGGGKESEGEGAERGSQELDDEGKMKKNRFFACFFWFWFGFGCLGW